MDHPWQWYLQSPHGPFGDDPFVEISGVAEFSSFRLTSTELLSPSPQKLTTHTDSTPKTMGQETTVVEILPKTSEILYNKERGGT